MVFAYSQIDLTFRASVLYVKYATELPSACIALVLLE